MGTMDDKIAIVTGAGSGIGRAAALAFAQAGAGVAIVDIRAAEAETVAEEIVEQGGSAIAVEADVTSAADAERLVTTTEERLGAVHVLYNNAGVNSTGGIADAEEADWDRCLAVNAKGTFLCSRAAVPAMERAGGGSIVNQGSVAALVGIRGFAAYCAAKGAVVALTRAMALDLAPRHIRVNCICPGTVFTPLMEPLMSARGNGDVERGIALTVEKYPIGRLGSPEDIARVALFLAGDDAAFMTGSVIAADGGMTAQ